MNRQRPATLYNRKLAALAAILLALAVFFWLIMRYSRSPMIRLAELQFVQIHELEPDTLSKPMSSGLEAFYDKDYSSALISFGTHIKQYPQSWSGYFFSGLTHLYQAPLRILGVTLAFDPQQVHQALSEFDKANEYAPTAAHRTDCLWYMAKAHLMLGQPDTAEEFLRRIIEIDHAPARVQDARGMLQRLDVLK